MANGAKRAAAPHRACVAKTTFEVRQPPASRLTIACARGGAATAVGIDHRTSSRGEPEWSGYKRATIRRLVVPWPVQILAIPALACTIRHPANDRPLGLPWMRNVTL